METKRTIYVIATKDTPRKYQMSGSVFIEDITHAGYFFEKENAQSHIDTMLNTKEHFVLPVTLTYEYAEVEVI